MTLTIIIKGKGAEELFPVGPKDLTEYFFPKYFNVQASDIVTCRFDNISPENIEKRSKGMEYVRQVHEDNIGEE